MNTPRRILIVGGSIGAVETATGLRDLGFDGDVTVLSDELTAPYLRVPLSKKVLAGSQDPASTAIAMSAGEAEVMLGAKAVALDRCAKVVVTADGREWAYDSLVVATGARARRISSDPEELVLRTQDDGALLASRLGSGSSLVVVGAGFLGMEIASTAAGLGLDVTVVDRDKPLERLLGSTLSAWVVERATQHAVRFVHASSGVTLSRRDGKLCVVTGPGEALSADVVVTAAGDRPNVEWLAGAGLDTEPGLRVDPTGRAADDIYGVGDVTARRGNDGQWHRTPYWSASVEQARAVAAAIAMDELSPRSTTPYYWTEQFGLTLRVCGQFPPVGLPIEMEGCLAEGSAILGWRGVDGEVSTVAAINHRVPVGRLKARIGAPRQAVSGR